MAGARPEVEEFMCKICPKSRSYKTAGLFMSHLASCHSAAEGGSHICRYGDNGICSACPGVGISMADYTAHCYRHHLNGGGKNGKLENWSVLSSTVNLPAVLNDPGKGKQKDFFTRSWGVDFADSALLPPSPHLCELPPNAFDRYLRKVRKHYSKASVNSTFSAVSPSSASSPGSSRETTPSPLPSTSSPPRPVQQPAQKLDIPDIFLDQNFDLSNPATFNAVFPFLSESLGQSRRSNPFTIESEEARAVETSGRLVQEQLQHYIDQVEVSIAGQVASKSHHFFQVMTYHDALMCQLLALISVVRTLRERLAAVEGGVVTALKVPQLALRKSNLEALLRCLNTVETLHNTQGFVQVQLSRQEFSGALDLISTSLDILNNEVVDVEALKGLPGQLGDLEELIGKMLLGDLQSAVSQELNRDLPLPVRATDGKLEGESQVEEGNLGAILQALVRQQSFTFLEFLEEQAVAAVKSAIKQVVVGVIEPKQEGTLTNLMAEYAEVAASDAWTDLLDMLVGALSVVVRRVHAVHMVVQGSLEEEEGEAIERLRSTAAEVMVNICDQVHERLGKLLTVRSRPAGIVLVTPQELAKVAELVGLLGSVTQELCGRPSAGLQLSHQGQVILYLQTFHEEHKSAVLAKLEGERWRKGQAQKSELDSLHSVLGERLGVADIQEGKETVEELLVGEESHTFAEAVIPLLSALSSYLALGDSLPNARVEVGLKVAELLKLFNSRTCQLVLGAGAVNMAGLKTITIRNLAVTLRSLSLVSGVIPDMRSHLLSCPSLSDRQEVTLARNLDSAARDYSDHLGELERKIIQIVDAALQHQLASWERKPPVPSPSFKAIGKQLSKLLEAVQDVLPTPRVALLFTSIHNQFLSRVGDKLKQARLVPDNSPTHGLVLSELIFYRENLRYLGVLSQEELSDRALQAVWQR